MTAQSIDLEEQRQEATESLRILTQREIDSGSKAASDEAVQKVWETLQLFQESSFYTVKNLEFHYYIKGNEMFVDRKEKTITKASVAKAYGTLLSLKREDGEISGPKKLNCFGASYLYPVFQKIGLI